MKDTTLITKYLRDIVGTAALKIWGTTASSARGVELTPAQVRDFADVYSQVEVDAAIEAIELTPGPAGADGQDGSDGATGATGPAGPNLITSATATDLVGVFFGDGANVGVLSFGDGLSYEDGVLSADGGIGGSTGATDNAILRADGTGGATAQASGVTISDTSEVLIVSGSVASNPFTITAAASQTGDLFRTRSSANVIGARITSACDFSNAKNGGEAFGLGAISGGGGISIGRNAYTASNRNSSAVGDSAECSGFFQVAIGFDATINAGHGSSIAIGCQSATTAANQLVFGTATNFLNHVVISGGASGVVKVGPSYSVDAFQFDNSATAGNTRLLVWDVDSGALVRVSVGADDSGGTGYKVLRVPN